VDAHISEFQESISDMYPYYERGENFMGSVVEIPTVVDHIFKSRDRSSSVTVSISMISYTTSRYEGWEPFISEFNRLFSVFKSLFNVDVISRVGLRYINAVRPSSIGGNISGLSSLIESEFIPSRFTDIGELEGHMSNVDLLLDDKRCRCVYGTIRFNDNGESGFLIDTDVFTEREMDADAIRDRLCSFNDISKKVFCKIATHDLQRSVGL
jgi:uncharacterized protein (TIGR04255 family)